MIPFNILSYLSTIFILTLSLILIFFLLFRLLAFLFVCSFLGIINDSILKTLEYKSLSTFLVIFLGQIPRSE